jgi:hypothetical protein
MIVWWLAGVAVLGTVALWMALNGSRRRNAVIFFIAPFIALAMWSGNVNPFIVTLLVGVWVAHDRGRPGIAGALIAIAAGLKLTPVLLIWWFVARREWSAVRGFLVAGAAVAAVSLVGAGLDNHFEYLSVMRTTASSGASPWSVSGVLANSGVSRDLASLATFAWVLAGGAAVWLLRHRPRASFSMAVLTVLYASPVVLLGNLAALLAATAPYPGRRRPLRGSHDA